MDDTAIYNGKEVDLRQKMTEISQGMKDVNEFVGMVSVNRFQEYADISSVPKVILLVDYLASSTTDKLDFELIAFDDPFYIAYSSGTTGIPKCIVHSIGRCLISTIKEILLHREMGPEDTILQYTTTGWIMYFFAISSIVLGSRSILYDGSPFQPDPITFIKLVGEQKVTIFGTSPRWMAEIQKNKIVPRNVTDLSNLKKVITTGMVLSDQLFEWFYDVGFPAKVHLGNISGGTDLVNSI